MIRRVVAEHLTGAERGKIEFRRAGIVLCTEHQNGFGYLRIQRRKKRDFAPLLFLMSGVFLPVHGIPGIPGVMPDGASGLRMTVRHHEAQSPAGTFRFVLFPSLAPHADGKRGVLSAVRGKVQRNLRIVTAGFLRLFHIQYDQLPAVPADAGDSIPEFPLIRRGDLRRQRRGKTPPCGQESGGDNRQFHFSFPFRSLTSS